MVCLATWRRDGFVSLEAEYEGRFTTVPITSRRLPLKVIAWTRFRGEIRVELVDASGDSLPSSDGAVGGYSFEDCDVITGDMLRHTVTWRGNSDLSAWAGRPVRLRFQMRRVRLYAMRFT